MTADNRSQILLMYSESPDKVLGTYSDEELLCGAIRDLPRITISTETDQGQTKKRTTRLKRPCWQDDWCVPITASNAEVLGLLQTEDLRSRHTTMTTTSPFKSGGCVKNVTINGTKSMRLLWQKEARNPRRLMLSPAGSLDLAKILVSQEKAQDLTAQGLASGRRWPASLAKFDPSTCSWRIAQHSLLGDLEPFSETWPRWGTMRNGECWERLTWERRTSGTDCGFWRTPTAQEAGARIETLETKDGEAAKIGQRAYRRKPDGSRKLQSVTLGQQVRMVPTVTVCGNYNRKGASATSGDGLATVVGGALNPTWVDWLMGWPLNWTSLDVLCYDAFKNWEVSHGKEQRKEAGA